MIMLRSELPLSKEKASVTWTRNKVRRLPRSMFVLRDGKKYNAACLPLCPEVTEGAQRADTEHTTSLAEIRTRKTTQRDRQKPIWTKDYLMKWCQIL